MEEVEECDQKGLLLEYMRKASQSPPPFLVKTYMLVEDPATDEVISWNEEGRGFIVWQTAEFSRDLLPTLFKHSNFSSFIRQLNTYGFRKVATSRWEFSNEMFRKGEKELLSQIRRKKACSTSTNNNKNYPSSSCNNNAENDDDDDHHHNHCTQKETCDEEQQRYSSSATSSSSEYNCLIDENKRLKKENCVLSSELFAMKMKCKELLHLITIHHTTSSKVAEKEINDGDEEKNEKRPKLFGVRLEVEEEIIERKRKRKRDEISKSVNVFLSQSCK